MQVKPAFSKRFYCYPATNEVEGPFELVELAGLLQDKLINGETQTLREGEDAWLPFQDRTEYNLAREMTEDAVARYAKEKVEAQAQVSSFNPGKLLPLLWMLIPVLLYLLYRVGLHIVHHLLYDSY
jgi:hypothetical protein